ncbi:MAG: hypothetical protein AAGG69_10170 [Pseudomonadota bacterium]
MTLMVLGGLVYAGMFALTIFVEPNPREMTVRVPNDRLNPRPIPRVEAPDNPTAAESSDQSEATDAE